MGTYLSYLRIPALASSLIAAMASALLYFKQNELIYPRNFPIGSRTEEGLLRPSRWGMTDFEDLRITTPDGETLSAFFIRPSNKAMVQNVTILMFHGNAGNIGHRVPIAKILEENSGCNIFMPEYRGYGLSSGTPNEQGLLIDAQTALDYIRQQEETRGGKIVIYGQSLGGAVAIQIAARNQEAGDIAGLILENTFTTMRKLIPSVIPPAKYLVRLCHQIWASEDILPQITTLPILFISGLKDEIVPPSHMQQLYSVCRAKRKVWKAIPNGSHNDTVAEPYFFEYFLEFISEVS